MQGFDFESAEGYFAVGDQQHAEDEVGDSGCEFCEEGVVNSAGYHCDGEHPVFELLQNLSRNVV